MRLDVPGGHALGVERDDVASQALQATFALADRDRLEGAVAVPRDLQVDLADLGRDRLRIRAVAAVARPPALDGVWLVTHMIGHLDLETTLEHLAHQRRQQPVLAGQFDALATGPVDQLGRPIPHRRLVTHHGNATRTQRPHRRSGPRRSCTSGSHQS